MRAGGQTARTLHLSVDGNDAAHGPIQGMKPRNESWHCAFVHPIVGDDNIGVLLSKPGARRREVVQSVNHVKIRLGAHQRHQGITPDA